MIGALCWDPVITDCNGAPDTIVAYMDQYAYARIVGWDVCTLEDGTPYPCPIYCGPGNGCETFALLDLNGDPCIPPLPDPGPGEALFIRTTAFDAALNPDCGP